MSLDNVTVQNSAGQGLLFRDLYAVNGPDGAGQVNFRRLTCINNAFSGFKSQFTADNFIYESTFSHNGLDGIELGASPTVRMMNSTLSGNGRHGIYAYSPATCTWCGLLVIINNTFSGNALEGINIIGSHAGTLTNAGNLIANNQFSGGASTTGQASIIVSSSSGNNVVGNAFDGSLGGNNLTIWKDAVILSDSVSGSLVESNSTKNSFQDPTPYLMSSGDVNYTDQAAAFYNPPLIPDQIIPAQPSGSSATLIDANQVAGSTAGQKISIALSTLYTNLHKLGKTNGAVDARNLTGAQIIDLPLQIGIPGKYNVTLFLGGAVYKVQATINVGGGSSIVGLPIGNMVATAWSPASTLQAAPGAGLWAVVAIGGNGNGNSASLHDLVIDGNQQNAGTVNSAFEGAILVQDSSSVAISDTTVIHSGGHGILIRNSSIDDSRTWTQNALTRVMSISNQYSGLMIQNTEGVVVTQSQFENNGHNGVEVDTSPELYLLLSDLGGNLQNGVYAYAKSACSWCGNMVIIGNQFGNNSASGLVVQGATAGSNRIAGNEFISGSMSSANAAVVLNTTGGNQVVANLISDIGSQAPWIPWSYGIYSGQSTSFNWIAGNILNGSTSSNSFLYGTHGVDALTENFPAQ